MNDNLNILIKTLNNTPEIISNYVLTIPESDLEIKRGKDFWTIKEHIIHLEYVQDILHERILLFKNEELPIVKPYFPKNEKINNKFKNINEILNSYKLKRNKQLELLRQLDDSDLVKEAKHDEYKKYNIEIILNHILFHDYWHMYRIEELWLTKDEYLTY